MSAEDAKPVTASEAAPAELTPAPVTESTETPAASTETPAETKADAPTAEATTDAAPADKKPEDADKDEDKKPVEPVYSGALNYAAHHSGLEGIKSLIMGPKKRYFWFGDEAPITTQNLNNYLRGEKPKFSHPAAAWSSKTGKGLLYFAKTADEKANPAGVLVVADATDLNESHGFNEFSFKLDGTKHVFQTKSADERAGWIVAFKKVQEDAKAMKEEVTSSTEYKDAMASLNKPVTGAAAAVGATGAAPKKSSEAPKESTDKPATTESAEESKPAEEPKKEKKAPKSRSQSRGKRASIFGSMMGKKDEAEEKLAAKKEEKKADKESKKSVDEAKKDEPAAAEPVAAAETSAPETKTEDAATAAETPAAESKPAEEAKDEPAKTPSKASKRTSIFGKFFDKVGSPTTEKKESEVAPAPSAAKDETKDKDLPAAPAAEEPAKAEEPPKTDPVAIPGTSDKEDKKEEKLSSSTPKESFFSKMKSQAHKMRSPSSEVPPPLSKDENKETAEAKETSTTEPAVESAPAAEAKPEETPAATGSEEAKPNGVEKPAEKKEEPEKRRSSFFGSSFGTSKKEKPTSGDESEGSAKKRTSIFRNPSKLIKGQKEGKKANAPAKVDEETKVSDEAPKLEAPEQSQPLSEETKEDKPANQIGDVVPEAVQVGQAPAANATVSATA